MQQLLQRAAQLARGCAASELHKPWRRPCVARAAHLKGQWCCLAGNGLSDKPALFSSRSSSWTIDDYVEKDVPAIIRFVLKETKAQQVHFLGHSMVGSLCKLLGTAGPSAGQLAYANITSSLTGLTGGFGATKSSVRVRRTMNAVVAVF